MPSIAQGRTNLVDICSTRLDIPLGARKGQVFRQFFYDYIIPSGGLRHIYTVRLYITPEAYRYRLSTKL